MSVHFRFPSAKHYSINQALTAGYNKVLENQGAFKVAPDGPANDDIQFHLYSSRTNACCTNDGRAYTQLLSRQQRRSEFLRQVRLA
jgi:hypothetical protein